MNIILALATGYVISQLGFTMFEVVITVIAVYGVGELVAFRQDVNAMVMFEIVEDDEK